MAKRRSEILAEQLEGLLVNSAEVNGAVVVGVDGLVLAANLPSAGYDPNRVGAEGAALMGLSRRTLGNLNSGDFETAILQGSDGWIVALSAGSRAVLLGLTPPNVNIGMALIEMRDTASEIAGTLG